MVPCHSSAHKSLFQLPLNFKMFVSDVQLLKNVFKKGPYFLNDFLQII